VLELVLLAALVASVIAAPIDLLKERAQAQVEANSKGLYCTQFQTLATCNYNSNNGCSWNFSGTNSACSCDNYGNANSASNVAPNNPKCPNNGEAASVCYASNPLGHNLGSASSPTACAATATQSYYYFYGYTPSTGSCSGGGYGVYNGAESSGGAPVATAAGANNQNCNVLIGRTDGGQVQ